MREGQGLKGCSCGCSCGGCWCPLRKLDLFFFPDSTTEWRSVQSVACRYPKRPGLSIGDDVAENGAIRRTGSNRPFGASRSITPLIPHAPFGAILGHIVADGQTRPLWISAYLTLHAQSISCAVRGRDCDLPWPTRSWPKPSPGFIKSGLTLPSLSRMRTQPDTSSI